MHKGHRFGKLILTTCRQGQGAPLLDGCTTVDDREDHFGGLAIRLPGRDLALVVGWRGASMPNPRWWFKRRPRPVACTCEPIGPGMHDQGCARLVSGVAAGLADADRADAE